jgi:hypothetical protein
MNRFIKYSRIGFAFLSLREWPDSRDPRHDRHIALALDGLWI